MMPSRINPIAQPICLVNPELRGPSSWAEHTPFAMWLISVLRPRVLVELGTYNGTSYCAFCQAIEMLDLPTRAYAVDSWKGDPHNGANGPEILTELRSYHDPRYESFSSLLEMTFDEAVKRFADKEIDLLHIDGYHKYEAVLHDFETWRPKLSDRGVILFHDVSERIADFGVFQLWEDLAAKYPSFTFRHEHGLGVLAVGSDLPQEFRTLLSIEDEDAEQVRTLFRELGRRVRLEMERDSARADLRLVRKSLHLVDRQRLEQDFLLKKLQADLARERRIVARLKGESGKPGEYGCIRSEADIAEIDALRRRIALFESDIAELQSSRSWRLMQQLHNLHARMIPVGSRRRLALFKLSRLAEVIANEGLAAAARKVVRKAGWAGLLRTGADGSRRTWKPSGQPVFLLVSHQGGGGTERHVRELADALISEGVRPVIVRPSGSGSLLWEERDQSWSVTWYRDTPPDRGAVKEMLRLLAPAHMHVHHVMGLPTAVLDWLFESGLPYDWTFHDYFTVCPAPISIRLTEATAASRTPMLATRVLSVSETITETRSTSPSPHGASGSRNIF